MVNSFHAHTRCKFVPNVVDIVPHVGCTVGLIGSENLIHRLCIVFSSEV